MLNFRDLLAGNASAAPAPTAAAPAPKQAAAAPAPAPAQPAMQSTGDPQKDLELLLAGFSAAGATRVNPAEAAAVLAVRTAPEVAGVREPEETAGPVVEPPTSKPADVLAAESNKVPRRTAAVVQQELDTLLELHNKLVGEHEALKAEIAGYAAKVREEFAGETKLLEADKAKAYERAEGLEKELEATKALNTRAMTAIQQLQQSPVPAGAPASINAEGLAELSSQLLCKALILQGWEPWLAVAK